MASTSSAVSRLPQEDSQTEEDNVDLQEDVGEDNRGEKPGGEDAQDGEVFDTYEFGGQEDEQTAPEPVAQPEPKSISHLCGRWTDGQGVCTAEINPSRKFVCVDFPAIVKNKDRALKYLGGKDFVEKILSTNGRIELYFRPDDPFCKPSVSTDRTCSNLLVKVRRRKAPDPSLTSDGFEYQLEVLGVVDMMYLFDKPCDFQYLPVAKTDSGQPRDLLRDIVPSMDISRADYLTREVPLYLPPVMFSRREKPCTYSLQNDPTKLEPDLQPDSLRKKRVHGSYIISFGEEGVPSEPMDVARSNILRYFPSTCINEALEALKKLFTERPVWSKVACEAQLEPAYERQLKYLLPLVSYCFITGPWRNLWCKFGYDPRKQKEAKMYQVIDFRVRSPFFRDKVVRKRHTDIARSYQNQMNRSADTETSLEKDIKVETFKKNRSFNPAYMYRPDTVPPYRQMRYQLCDILEVQVQKKIHANDGQEVECTEREGWCVPDIADVARDVINSHVERLLGT